MVDSCHKRTGILFSEGSEIPNGFSVTGQYGWIGIGEPWSWRTVLEIINPDEFILSAYNISPQGDAAKANGTIFHRKPN